MFQLSNILLSALGSGVLVFIVLLFWKWSKGHFRFAVSSLSTLLGFTAWNLGVIAFVATVIALGLLTDRDETAWRVLVASGIAGLLATLVDLFFL